MSLNYMCFSTTLEKTVDTQRNTVITNLVKKNYFMSQVDNYIYKYDVNKLRCYTKAIDKDPMMR